MRCLFVLKASLSLWLIIIIGVAWGQYKYFEVQEFLPDLHWQLHMEWIYADESNGEPWPLIQTLSRSWRYGSLRGHELPEAIDQRFFFAGYGDDVSRNFYMQAPDQLIQIYIELQALPVSGKRYIELPLCFDKTEITFSSRVLSGLDTNELQCSTNPETFSAALQKPEQVCCQLILNSNQQIINLAISGGRFNPEHTTGLQKATPVIDITGRIALVTYSRNSEPEASIPSPLRSGNFSAQRTLGGYGYGYGYGDEDDDKHDKRRKSTQIVSSGIDLIIVLPGLPHILDTQSVVEDSQESQWAVNFDAIEVVIYFQVGDEQRSLSLSLDQWQLLVEHKVHRSPHLLYFLIRHLSAGQLRLKELSEELQLWIERQELLQREAADEEASEQLRSMTASLLDDLEAIPPAQVTLEGGLATLFENQLQDMGWIPDRARGSPEQRLRQLIKAVGLVFRRNLAADEVNRLWSENDSNLILTAFEEQSIEDLKDMLETQIKVLWLEILKQTQKKNDVSQNVTRDFPADYQTGTNTTEIIQTPLQTPESKDQKQINSDPAGAEGPASGHSPSSPTSAPGGSQGSDLRSRDVLFRPDEALLPKNESTDLSLVPIGLKFFRNWLLHSPAAVDFYRALRSLLEAGDISDERILWFVRYLQAEQSPFQSDSLYSMQGSPVQDNSNMQLQVVRHEEAYRKSSCEWAETVKQTLVEIFKLLLSEEQEGTETQILDCVGKLACAFSKLDRSLVPVTLSSLTVWFETHCQEGRLDQVSYSFLWDIHRRLSSEADCRATPEWFYYLVERPGGALVSGPELFEVSSESEVTSESEVPNMESLVDPDPPRIAMCDSFYSELMTMVEAGGTDLHQSMYEQIARHSKDDFSSDDNLILLLDLYSRVTDLIDETTERTVCYGIMKDKNECFQRLRSLSEKVQTRICQSSEDKPMDDSRGLQAAEVFASEIIAPITSQPLSTNREGRLATSTMPLFYKRAADNRPKLTAKMANLAIGSAVHGAINLISLYEQLVRPESSAGTWVQPTIANTDKKRCNYSGLNTSSFQNLRRIVLKRLIESLLKNGLYMEAVKWFKKLAGAGDCQLEPSIETRDFIERQIRRVQTALNKGDQQKADAVLCEINRLIQYLLLPPWLSARVAQINRVMGEWYMSIGRINTAFSRSYLGAEHDEAARNLCLRVGFWAAQQLGQPLTLQDDQVRSGLPSHMLKQFRDKSLEHTIDADFFSDGATEQEVLLALEYLNCHRLQGNYEPSQACNQAGRRLPWLYPHPAGPELLSQHETFLALGEAWSSTPAYLFRKAIIDPISFMQILTRLQQAIKQIQPRINSQFSEFLTSQDAKVISNVLRYSSFLEFSNQMILSGQQVDKNLLYLFMKLGLFADLNIESLTAGITGLPEINMAYMDGLAFSLNGAPDKALERLEFQPDSSVRLQTAVTTRQKSKSKRPKKTPKNRGEDARSRMLTKRDATNKEGVTSAHIDEKRPSWQRYSPIKDDGYVSGARALPVQQPDSGHISLLHRVISVLYRLSASGDTELGTLESELTLSSGSGDDSELLLGILNLRAGKYSKALQLFTSSGHSLGHHLAGLLHLSGRAGSISKEEAIKHFSKAAESYFAPSVALLYQHPHEIPKQMKKMLSYTQDHELQLLKGWGESSDKNLRVLTDMEPDVLQSANPRAHFRLLQLYDQLQVFDPDHHCSLISRFFRHLRPENSIYFIADPHRDQFVQQVNQCLKREFFLKDIGLVIDVLKKLPMLAPEEKERSLKRQKLTVGLKLGSKLPGASRDQYLSAVISHIKVDNLQRFSQLLLQITANYESGGLASLLADKMLHGSQDSAVLKSLFELNDLCGDCLVAEIARSHKFTIPNLIGKTAAPSGWAQHSFYSSLDSLRKREGNQEGNQANQELVKAVIDYLRQHTKGSHETMLSWLDWLAGGEKEEKAKLYSSYIFRSLMQPGGNQWSCRLAEKFMTLGLVTEQQDLANRLASRLLQELPNRNEALIHEIYDIILLLDATLPKYHALIIAEFLRNEAIAKAEPAAWTQMLYHRLADQRLHFQEDTLEEIVPLVLPYARRVNSSIAEGSAWIDAAVHKGSSQCLLLKELTGDVFSWPWPDVEWLTALYKARSSLENCFSQEMQGILNTQLERWTDSSFQEPDIGLLQKFYQLVAGNDSRVFWEKLEESHALDEGIIHMLSLEAAKNWLVTLMTEDMPGEAFNKLLKQVISVQDNSKALVGQILSVPRLLKMIDQRDLAELAKIAHKQNWSAEIVTGLLNNLESDFLRQMDFATLALFLQMSGSQSIKNNVYRALFDAHPEKLGTGEIFQQPEVIDFLINRSVFRGADLLSLDGHLIKASSHVQKQLYPTLLDQIEKQWLSEHCPAKFRSSMQGWLEQLRAKPSLPSYFYSTFFSTMQLNEGEMSRVLSEYLAKASSVQGIELALVVEPLRLLSKFDCENAGLESDVLLKVVQACHSQLKRDDPPLQDIEACFELSLQVVNLSDAPKLFRELNKLIDTFVRVEKRPGQLHEQVLHNTLDMNQIAAEEQEAMTMDRQRLWRRVITTARVKELVSIAEEEGDDYELMTESLNQGKNSWQALLLKTWVQDGGNPFVSYLNAKKVYNWFRRESVRGMLQRPVIDAIRSEVRIYEKEEKKWSQLLEQIAKKPKEIQIPVIETTAREIQLNLLTREVKEEWFKKMDQSIGVILSRRTDKKEDLDLVESLIKSDSAIKCMGERTQAKIRNHLSRYYINMLEGLSVEEIDMETDTSCIENTEAIVLGFLPDLKNADLKIRAREALGLSFLFRLAVGIRGDTPDGVLWSVTDKATSFLLPTLIATDSLLADAVIYLVKHSVDRSPPLLGLPLMTLADIVKPLAEGEGFENSIRIRSYELLAQLNAPGQLSAEGDSKIEGYYWRMALQYGSLTAIGKLKLNPNTAFMIRGLKKAAARLEDGEEISSKEFDRLSGYARKVGEVANLEEYPDSGRALSVWKRFEESFKQAGDGTDFYLDDVK